MVKTLRAAAFVILLSGLAPELHAQVLPGLDYGSVRLHVGLLSPRSTFTDRSFGESSFQNGMAVGASVLVWPMQGRFGVGAGLIRSQTDGYNAQYEYAPLAVNDPVQWLFTADVAVRHPLDIGFPYVSAGVGLKQYNWARSQDSEDRFFLWDMAAGFEYRPQILGRVALTAELRSYHSKFIGFGIDGGNWRPGTEARPGIGFYGGVVDGQPNHDLLFTVGVTLPF